MRTETRVVPAPGNLSTGMAAIPEQADLRLDVTMQSVAEGVLVSVTASAPMTGECARCLEPVSGTVEVSCQELFSYQQEDGAEAEDGYSLVGDLLDLEPPLRDALVLALPLAPRCAEDCPGLCVECGVPLAQAGPDHRHEAIDPRWAGLQQVNVADIAGAPEAEAGGNGMPDRQ